MLKVNGSFLWSLFLLALAAAGQACSDGTDYGQEPTAVTTKTASKATSGSAAAKRTDVDALAVSAKEFAFTLTLISIRPGAPGVDVVFKNDGTREHTLAIYADSAFKTKIADSGRVAAGQTSGFPFIPPEGAKSVYYRCEIHPNQMNGELPVRK